MQPSLSLFYRSRARQEVKAMVVSKCRQNFWTKRFQRNPHNVYLEDATKSLMVPCLHRINQVCSSWHDNRHTHTERLPYPSRMCRGLIMLASCSYNNISCNGAFTVQSIWNISTAYSDTTNTWATIIFLTRIQGIIVQLAIIQVCSYWENTASMSPSVRS